MATKQFNALGNLVIENAEVMFRNFQGREQQFNTAGDRNFCVFLDPTQSEQLRADGWNVKTLRAREEGDTPREYLQVSVNYDKGRPPKIVLITTKKRTDLDAETVAMLDFADVKNWDVVINPYAWEVGDNKGIKAYLKTAFVTLNEDALELKYADLEEDQDPTTSSSTASEED